MFFVYKVGAFHIMVENQTIHFRAFTQSLYTVVIFMLFIVITNFIVKIIDEEISKTKELVRQANTDALTGLSNRRCFEDDYEYLISHSTNLSGIIIDIDKFKLINDRYGHKVGDSVLQAFANLLISSVPDGCKIYRWGGEEFLILLPEFDLDTAYLVAEQIRKSVLKLKLLPDVCFSISSGVGIMTSDENIDEFITRIDKALYISKDGGRNMSTKSV